MKRGQCPIHNGTLEIILIIPAIDMRACYFCYKEHPQLKIIGFQNYIKRDSSTIDGNVEIVHSQYNCIPTSQVSIQFLSPTKLAIIVITLE